MKKSFVLLFLSFTLALASCGLRGRGGESDSLSNDTSESQVSDVKESKDDKGTFTVEWVNLNGEKLEVDKDVPYGTMAEYNSPTPEYPEISLRDQYVFAKWDPTPSIVTEDITYHAKYKQVNNNSDRIHITFDLNGGDSPSYKPEGIYIDHYDPSFFFFDVTKEGYDFRGWQCEGRQIFDEFGNNTNSYPHTSIKERTFTAMFDEAGNVSDSDLLNKFIMFSLFLDKNYITSVNLLPEKDNILSIHTQNYVWYREYEMDPSGESINSGGILKRPDNGLCSHYYIDGDNNLVLTESMSEDEYNTSSYNQNPSFINCGKRVVTCKDPYDDITKKVIRIEDISLIRDLIDTNARCGLPFTYEADYMNLIPYGEGDASNIWECAVHISSINEQTVDATYLTLFISLYDQKYDIPQVVEYLNDRTAVLSEEAIQVASIFDNICSYKNYTLVATTSFYYLDGDTKCDYDGTDFEDRSIGRRANYVEVHHANENSVWQKATVNDELCFERYYVDERDGIAYYINQLDENNTFTIIRPSGSCEVWEPTQTYTAACLSLNSNNYLDIEFTNYSHDGINISCGVIPYSSRNWINYALKMTSPGHGLVQGCYTDEALEYMYLNLKCSIKSFGDVIATIEFMYPVGTRNINGNSQTIFFGLSYTLTSFGATPKNVIPTVS